MIDSIILYFQFFTRIPIPVVIGEPEMKMRSGVRFFFAVRINAWIS